MDGFGERRVLLGGSCSSAWAGTTSTREECDGWRWLWPHSVAPRVISVSSVGSVVPVRRMNSQIARRRREEAEHEGRDDAWQAQRREQREGGGRHAASRSPLAL